MRLIAIVALGVALTACTDADWDNAMSYLPIERGSRSSGEAPVQQDAATTSTPVEGAQPVAMAPPEREADQPAQNTSVAAAQRDDPHCRAVAAQRATDGSYMGMDEDQQKQEYDLTYADCVAWDNAHGGPPR